MCNNSKYIYRSVAVLWIFLCLISCSRESNYNFPEIVKVSLRDVGHHLLLNNQDSVSAVKPIIAITKNKYQLAFEKNLSIHPDSLASQIRSSFLKANLPKHYLVEVVSCDGNEVAYSYLMKEDVEKGIIPCRGRQIKNGCYLVNVRFKKIAQEEHTESRPLYLMSLGVLMFLLIVMYKKKKRKIMQSNDSNFISIGSYKFYPEQNKLIKETIETSLSKKECELLALFVAQPNQIIKREELMKQVWEDNGVVVGRSLDTYISKLRKKLQEDDSIKLSNIHGVGYKLEIQ